MAHQNALESEGTSRLRAIRNFDFHALFCSAHCLLFGHVPQRAAH
jgi:hypothetical protein